VKRLWAFFFILWPIVAITAGVISPSMHWWFPGAAQSPIGQRIDDLFYMILIIVTVVFIGTQVAMGYVLLQGARDTDAPGRAMFTHGSHALEVIWTVVPAGVLLFIAFYQLDTWAAYRVKENYPMSSRLAPIAEVTARQFEWRIRYPHPTRKFEDLAQVDDRGMQELLREVPGDKLIIALKAADEKLKEKFFKNMSERAAQMMKDDLESKGPVKLSDVEAAQKEILMTTRKMADEGRLQLGGKGGEEYV